MTYIEDLVRSIDGQIRDVQKTIASLEAARSRLVDGAVPRPAPAHKRTARRTRTAKSKSTQVVPAGVLGRLLSANPGLTTSALANTAGADRDQVLALLKEMERAGDARRTGARAGTRWFAITDEDKIEARASELAARAKQEPSSGRRRATRR
jgi:hypothetical protein